MSKLSNVTKSIIVTTLSTSLVLSGTVSIHTIGQISNIFAQGNSNVCAGAGGWTKVNNPGNSFTYNSPSGEAISEVCIKGGNEENSANGYIFTTPPESLVHNCNITGPNGQLRTGSVTVSGLGSSSITVVKEGNGCADISHSAFYIAQVQPSPTPDVIPDPSPTPEPTPTPEILADPSPTPTATPVSTPTPTPTSTPSSNNNSGTTIASSESSNTQIATRGQILSAIDYADSGVADELAFNLMGLVGSFATGLGSLLKLKKFLA